jgi:hypothetical protein
MNLFYVIAGQRWVPARLIVAAVMLLTSVVVPLAALSEVPVVQRATRPAPTGPDAETLAEFQERLDRYAALHQKLEQDLPSLPREATAQELTDRQQTLLKRLQAARANAKQGEVFTPAMQAYVKRMMTSLFSGNAGKQLRASIMDENPVSLKLTVNMAYPTKVPLSTMPPAVLERLPKPPEEFEYRFIGDDLILLDSHAQMIVDFVPQALPK